MYICGMEKKIKELEQGIYDLTKQLAELKDKPFVTAKAIFFPYKHEDELKPKFEVGKWYKLTRDYGILKKDMVFMYVRRQDDDNKYPFVIVNHQMFSEVSDGGKNYLAPNEDQLIEATNEEVQTALIKEAKKRGFKEGVSFLSTNGNKKHTLLSSNFTFENLGHIGKVLGTETCWFYHNGKWATIIDTPLMINGYEMKQDGDIIVFGFGQFHKEQLKDLLLDILDTGFNGYDRSSNRTIKSITLDDGMVITTDQLKQIVDKIK
jgi:hypothetical protein